MIGAICVGQADKVKRLTSYAPERETDHPVISRLQAHYILRWAFFFDPSSSAQAVAAGHHAPRIRCAPIIQYGRVAGHTDCGRLGLPIRVARSLGNERRAA